MHTTPPSSAEDPAGFPRLLADIGGTNARFAWVGAPGEPPSQVRTLQVADHAGPAQAAQVYLQHVKNQQAGRAWHAPRCAAFAVATAVTGDRVAFTNSAWAFSREAVRQALGLQLLAVINDFEALALALPGLAPTQYRPLGGPALALHADARVGTALAVLGPGTGLGVGAVLRTRAGWQAIPGEGGHVTLAAADALEAEVIDVVRRAHGHVSAERLLAGPGLPLLQAALGAVQGRVPVADATPEAIVAAALQGSDALASDTLDLFARLLGSLAGNLALTLGARGGVFVGGGVVPRLGGHFAAAAFRERFEAKGRFRDYLAAVPTVLITDTLAALGGAALAIDAAA